MCVNSEALFFFVPRTFLFAGMIVSSTLVSVLSVLLVAIDRFLYILYGLQYQRYIFPNRARILIVTTWIFGELLAVFSISSSGKQFAGFVVSVNWINGNWGNCRQRTSFTSPFTNSMRNSINRYNNKRLTKFFSVIKIASILSTARTTRTSKSFPLERKFSFLIWIAPKRRQNFFPFSAPALQVDSARAFEKRELFSFRFSHFASNL